MKKIIILLSIIFTLSLLQAAVGCSLNEPDKEVKRFFPGSTGYKTEYISIQSQGGEETAKVSCRFASIIFAVSSPPCDCMLMYSGYRYKW